MTRPSARRPPSRGGARTPCPPPLTAVDEFLEQLFRSPGLDAELQVMHVEPARRRSAGPELLAAGLPIPLARALETRGVRQLFSHQARAWESLLLFPTKALSRDQLASLQSLIEPLERSIAAAVYDGDTPSSVRRAIREEADLVLTNPYMLHSGILPHHSRFPELFRGLEYVVVDELHMYRGVFGSHVAHVLRRLKRLARFYGSDPAFVLASATIGNPKEFAEELIHAPVTLIDESDAPQGQHTFVSVTPPVLHRQLGIRRSAIQQAVELFGELLETGLKCIFFHQTRNGVEVLLKYFQDLLRKKKQDPERVRGYRGGYLPSTRRQIEENLREGRVTAVVATCALELGMDIGGLDVAVLVGYPGSTAATLQRAGRAGRRGRAGLSMLIPRSTATDHYIVRHPARLFRQRPETAAIDPHNTLIRASHLKCAAFELPLRNRELDDEQDQWIVAQLCRESRILTRIDDRIFFAQPSFPAHGVSLNTGDMDNFVILDADSHEPIAEIDRASAINMVHPEAIYNLEGCQYYIESMDYVGRRVIARSVDVNYYTEAEVETEVRVLTDHRERQFGDSKLWFGDLCIEKVTPMYKKIRFYPRETIGAGAVNLPAEELDTQGLAWVIPETLLSEQNAHGEVRGAVLAALADLCRNVIPIRVRCEAQNLGAKAEVRSRHFDQPAIFLWDEVPGGVGLAEAALADFPWLLQMMLEVVEQCPCEASCPSCIGASLRDGRREKESVRALLRHASFPRPDRKLLA